jgi:Co/Zn/Cd efflux system component
MNKSDFHISKMDCPSEEQLIRMKLMEMKGIKKLDFDLNKRQLNVYHSDNIELIQDAIKELDLGEKLINSSRVDDVDFSIEKNQKTVLWTILVINFSFFIIESLMGFFSSSMGLVADSLDMLADSVVYGLSLLVVGSTVINKKKVAWLAGYFQITLALLGFIEVLRRFIFTEELPNFKTMVWVSILALIANAICLILLNRSKQKEETHMKASIIFTSNDIIINIGVMFTGLMVYWLNSNKPDLIIGFIVFVIVLIGARRILKLSK